MTTPILGDGRDKGVVYIEYSQPGDKHYHPPKDGCYQFVTIWWSEHFHTGPSWRGQVFYAKPDYYLKYWAAKGLTVHETEKPR